MIRLVASHPRSTDAFAAAALGGNPARVAPVGEGVEPRRVNAAAIDPIPAPPDGAAAWTREPSYAFCERIARSHYENFPVASRFVPAALRPHVWALYAFARSADDFADEPRWEGRRREALDHWEDQLERAFHGESEHPIFVALAATVEKRDIPISPLRDLLTAFRMDLTTRRYATWDSLLTYVEHSAMPVGRLLLYVFDYRDARLHRYADDIAAALELTHFLQDLPADLRRDRIYLPQEDLRHFAVDESDLRAGRATRAVRDLMLYECARVRSLFMRGRPLTTLVGRDLGIELGYMWERGMSVLEHIEEQDGDVFSHRPALSRVDKVRAILKSAARRLGR